jgi:hypothetical protein
MRATTDAAWKMSSSSVFRIEWLQPNQCRASAGPVPGQRRTSAGPVLGQCRASAGPVPGQCWASAEPVPGQCWASAGPVLGQCRANAGPVPGQCRASAGPVPGQCGPVPGQCHQRCHATALGMRQSIDGATDATMRRRTYSTLLYWRSAYSGVLRVLEAVGAGGREG